MLLRERERESGVKSALRRITRKPRGKPCLLCPTMGTLFTEMSQAISLITEAYVEAFVTKGKLALTFLRSFTF